MILHWLARNFLHYGHAFEIRGLLLSEYLRLRRREPATPAGLAWRVWRWPSAMEDLLNIARFVSPKDKVLLIDIGGNVGKWSSDFVSYFPKTDIVAFEPDPRAYAKYGKRFEGRPGVQLHQIALSASKGQAPFHLGEDTVYSSLEAYADTQSGRGIAMRSDCTVAIETLDSFEINTAGYEATVLKIDVQGHEVEALLGSSTTLQKVDLVIGELSFASEYDGTEPSFSRVCELLHAAGLHPAIFQCYGRQLGPHAFERDVVFVRRNRLDRLYGWD
jgi:FkbM family methyltransferase